MGSWRVGHDWATSLSLSCIGEGTGNPLQCSCLENPRDRGAWWAAVYGVAQSRTRLKQFSSSSSRSLPESGPCSPLHCQSLPMVKKTEKERIGGLHDSFTFREVWKLSHMTMHMPKPLTVWITINCGKFLKRWEYQTTWPASREICIHVRKQQLELDMEQQTGSK